MKEFAHFRHRFVSNKRGYVSFIIFCLICFLSIFAEFIANDQPLIVHYKGRWMFPAVHTYTQQDMDEDSAIFCDFKDDAIQEKIRASNGMIIWPPIPFGVDTMNTQCCAPSPPSKTNWLGTDDQGRDVLARIIYGFRSSIIFALGLSILSTFLGIVFGSIQGYLGGIFDLYMQRIIEIWNSIPVLYLLIILASLVKPNIAWLLVIVGFFSWVPLSQLVRAEVFRTKKADYIMAALALGAGPLRVMVRHILPNATIAALTYAPFIVNQGVITLTSLDFLGFGLPSGSASLGDLITQAKNNIHAPWLGIAGFVILSSLLVLLTFIGEAVRESLNPYKNRGKIGKL
jgi:microcin C transport system permease protein